MSDEVGRQRVEEIVRQGLQGAALVNAITAAVTQAVERERQRCVAEHAAINALTRAQQGEIARLTTDLAGAEATNALLAEHAAINALTRAQQVEIGQLRDALAQTPPQRGR